MAELDRIYGAELSPYSVKVRSYYRYKGLPHRWIMRNSDTMAEYQKYARVPIIPLVVTGDDRAMQDSTPIIEALEAANPEPSIHPTDPVAAFVSALIEEFGDEWGNKWMFHLRWAREVDQVASARRIASSMLAKANEEQVEAMAEQIRERMLGRVWFVGSSEQTGPQIEASFREGLAELDAHLATRPYLFGARPAFGDFGLWGQVYEAWTDPTGAALVETVPNVLDWVHRMTWPRAEGDSSRRANGAYWEARRRKLRTTYRFAPSTSWQCRRWSNRRQATRFPPVVGRGLRRVAGIHSDSGRWPPESFRGNSGRRHSPGPSSGRGRPSGTSTTA